MLPTGWQALSLPEKIPENRKLFLDTEANCFMAQHAALLRSLTISDRSVRSVSDVHYPILADGSSRIQMMENDEAYDPSHHRLGGVLTATIYFRDLIKGILPDGSNGIAIVFDNPCNPSFTYQVGILLTYLDFIECWDILTSFDAILCSTLQINGPNVKYLGTADHHEPKFDYLEVMSSLNDFGKISSRGSPYTGIPINTDICPFDVRVYPSTTMEAQYMTSQPITITVIIISIFIVTSGVFVLYDVCVEKRQRLVMNSAIRSNAIVDSLFPSNVRDRLITPDMQRQTKGIQQDERKALRMSLDSDCNQSCPPIADLFPEVVRT